MPTVAEDIRAMADHIERVGLNQDGGFFKGICSFDVIFFDRPCCVVGAFAVVKHKLPRDFYSRSSLTPKTLKAIEEGLEARGFYPLVEWSDNTPHNEVVATLRELADELEEEYASK